MRTAIYTRVSTLDQSMEGFSLDAQLDRLRSYCDSQGWTVADIYTDEGISAKSTERPALQRLFEDMRQGRLDVVLVYKLDRLTRNVVDLHTMLQEFERYRVGFKSASEVFDTTTAMGRLFLTIVAAMAQWERENLSERTRMGQMEMTRQGRWSGGRAAFGYRLDDGNLVIYEPEAMIVREIFRRYNDGIGTVKLLQWLNDPEHPQLAPRERWTQNALKYVLRNPLYAGQVRYGYRNLNGTRQTEYMVQPGTHDGIITTSEFEVAEHMRQKRRTQPGRSYMGSYPLTGILYCGKCGSPMNGRTHYRRNKELSPARRQYICIERQHSGLCDMPIIKAEDIEGAVISKIRSYYDSAVREPVVAEEHRVDIDIASELGKLRTRRKRWLDAYERGDISSSDMRERIATIDREEMQLRSVVDEVSTVDPADIRAMMQTLLDGWNVLDAAEKKELSHLIIERIDVIDKEEIDIVYRA